MFRRFPGETNLQVFVSSFFLFFMGLGQGYDVIVLIHASAFNALRHLALRAKLSAWVHWELLTFEGIWAHKGCKVLCKASPPGTLGLRGICCNYGDGGSSSSRL